MVLDMVFLHEGNTVRGHEGLNIRKRVTDGATDLRIGYANTLLAMGAKSMDANASEGGDGTIGKPDGLGTSHRGRNI
jgi:hypothetical protein